MKKISISVMCHNFKTGGYAYAGKGDRVGYHHPVTHAEEEGTVESVSLGNAGMHGHFVTVNGHKLRSLHCWKL